MTRRFQKSVGSSVCPFITLTKSSDVPIPKFLLILILKINGVPILEIYGVPIPILEIKLICDKEAININ